MEHLQSTNEVEKVFYSQTLVGADASLPMKVNSSNDNKTKLMGLMNH